MPSLRVLLAAAAAAALANWPAWIWRALAHVVPGFEFEEGDLPDAQSRWPEIAPPQ